jgi:hypothetical protein
MQLFRSKMMCGAAAMLLLSACGEVKGTGTDGGGSGSDADFTLSVDQSALTIPIAGSASVNVTVERTGSVGDIMLTADGLGASLTADISPNPIAGGSATAQVTINVAGGSLPAMSTVTITGTAGGKTHSATVTVTTTTITVTGTVRGGRAGVKVGIIGKQSVTSGAGGVFMFTDVTPPYDLYTFAPQGCGSSSTPSVFFFDDLTRADPVVTAATYTPTCGFFVACFFPGPSAPVSGTKSGTGNNTDPVVFAWSEGAFTGTLNANGTFSGTASWCSGNTSTGALHALQFTRKQNGAPNTFLGYARTATTYTSGSATTTNLNFTAVNSSATITGTLNGPAGMPMPTIFLNQQFDNTLASLWTQNTTAAVDASFPLIPAAGGTALYAQTTMTGLGTSLFVQPLTATATVNFTMPAPAMLTMPADAATGVTTTTTFAWTASPGVVSQIFFSGAGARFSIYTTKTMATIPVIPELALPSGTAFNWSVTAFAPAASTNDAAAANELESVSSIDSSGPAHATSTSVGRGFTTQ